MVMREPLRRLSHLAAALAFPGGSTPPAPDKCLAGTLEPSTAEELDQREGGSYFVRP
jgi:hypothetical protein